MKDFLSPKELADLWGYSTDTLCNWRVANKGPRWEKWGWSVVYPKKAVQAYERKHPEVRRKPR